MSLKNDSENHTLWLDQKRSFVAANGHFFEKVLHWLLDQELTFEASCSTVILLHLFF